MSSNSASSAKRARGNDEEELPKEVLTKSFWARSQSEVVELNFKW